MAVDPHAERKRISFEQAEGAEPLPSQLQPKEVSRKLRSILWLIFHSALERSTKFSVMGDCAPWLEEPWKTILFDKHVFRDHGLADEFDNNARRLTDQVKEIFAAGDYLAIFGFVEWVLRHKHTPYGFDKAIERALRESRAAYTVVEGKTIVPVASEEERRSLERVFSDVASTEFNGTRAHLHKAAAALTSGDYAGSVRESIHAVESAARTLEPSTNGLSPALGMLEKRVAIHPALRSGFEKLYGFTSDEDGIRHALLEKDAAAVDETDALYMLGACAAFVSYLINKARIASLPKKG